MMRLIHNVTHAHLYGRKDGVGEFIACQWRLIPSQCHVSFRPDLDGAGWRPVPDDFADIRALLALPDAHAVMAMIRS